MQNIDFKESNTVIAKSQPQYKPLYAYKRGDATGEVSMCFSLSLRERIKLLITGKLWVSVLTFGYPFQPMLMTVDKENVYLIPRQQCSDQSELTQGKQEQ